jgi:hypothetical protein
MKNNPNNTHLPEIKFHEYLDGELSPDETKRFEVHLAGCKACTKELAFWQGTFARIESLPEVALNRNLSTKLIPKLQNGREISNVLNMILAEAALGTTLAIVLWPVIKTLFVATALNTEITLQFSLLKVKGTFISLFEPLTPGQLDWLGLTVESLLGETFWLPTIIAALVILLVGNGIILKTTKTNH